MLKDLYLFYFNYYINEADSIKRKIELIKIKHKCKLCLNIASFLLFVFLKCSYFCTIKNSDLEIAHARWEEVS